jgi:hypothetical protein
VNDETRARESAGNPRICVSDGIVYMAPWGYTPMGMNGMGEMLATNGDDIMTMPRVGRTTSGKDQ